ncbi:hypothetical protein OG874_42900 [Nocardia sp. NBC_00565]|uniref:hypothetical protein n=1 Tax=Nocardia sp. NBC_00565 TaxID=2975993 RepID=UPI002E806A4A|nr:hypothetical protein [Nocardia sp. NBC_00565]WUC03335.1 hypothetical protein OG874_42900 [Nocardia sp. NBC_00565]
MKKFLERAGLRAVPAMPWPADSPDVKRLDVLVAELFPDMATAMNSENADIADAFICFLGECYIKFARAQWFDYEWRGREHSFYDHVNPALRWRFDDGGNDADEEVTAWSLMESVAMSSKYEEGFSSVAYDLRNDYARRTGHTVT